MTASIDLDPRRQQRPSLRDVAADHIRTAIFAGDLQPGSKLDQDRVANELGISKLPVREAIVVLEQEGMVEAIARRGAFVAMLQPEDFLDHYRIFAQLTGMAAERAATRITTDELNCLEKLLLKMERWTEADREYDSEKLNFRFHRIINRAGGSRRLNVVLRSLAAGMPDDLYHRTRGWTKQAQREHRQIFEALQDRDSERVREAAIGHVEEGGHEVITSLKNLGFWDDSPLA